MTELSTALLNKESLMDCTLMTEDKGMIQFHKVALASMSEYFDKLFFGEFKESKEETIQVTGSFPVWKSIKNLVYTGRGITGGMGVHLETLEALYKYDLKIFADRVWGYMKEIKKLDRFVALRLLRFAVLHEHDYMGKTVMSAIRSSFQRLMDDYKWIKEYATFLEGVDKMPEDWVGYYSSTWQSLE